MCFLFIPLQHGSGSFSDAVGDLVGWDNLGDDLGSEAGELIFEIVVVVSIGTDIGDPGVSEDGEDDRTPESDTEIVLDAG